MRAINLGFRKVYLDVFRRNNCQMSLFQIKFWQGHSRLGRWLKIHIVVGKMLILIAFNISQKWYVMYDYIQKRNTNSYILKTLQFSSASLCILLAPEYLEKKTSKQFGIKLKAVLEGNPCEQRSYSCFTELFAWINL